MCCGIVCAARLHSSKKYTLYLFNFVFFFFLIRLHGKLGVVFASSCTRTSRISNQLHSLHSSPIIISKSSTKEAVYRRMNTRPRAPKKLKGVSRTLEKILSEGTRALIICSLGTNVQKEKKNTFTKYGELLKNRLLIASPSLLPLRRETKRRRTKSNVKSCSMN